MSTVSRQPFSAQSNGKPPLVNGDRMGQAEFHRRYKACPSHEKYELIGGIVYMSSPSRVPHGSYHGELSYVLKHYQASTPGVQHIDNTTVILSDESEPQPDLALRLLPEYGGQSRENEEEYLEGAPELVAEIAYSSRNIDLHRKRDDYQQAGVIEYLVLSIEDQQLFWFHFPDGDTIGPNRQGISRSRVFPGLWIDPVALLAQDSARLIAVVQQELAGRDHAAFVRRLERRRHR